MDNAVEDAARSIYYSGKNQCDDKHALRIFAPKTCFFCKKTSFKREKNQGFTKMFFQFLKGMPPGRLIALGFASVILLGTLLLLLPISIRPGIEINFVDALFTSTSAVCVTGLIAIDTADHFTTFGQVVVALLIQVGGLGVTSVGVGFILAAVKRVSIKGRLIVKETFTSTRKLWKKSVFKTVTPLLSALERISTPVF